MDNFMLDSSGSEDEFPAVSDIIRRHRSKPNPTTLTTSTKVPIKLPALGQDDKENIPSPKAQLKHSSMTPQKVQATPLRRRKLGVAQTQAVDGSLFQPWTAQKDSSSKGRETSRLKGKSSRALLRQGSIESFASSSMDTSRDFRSKNRPRLEVDSDDDDPFLRRRAKSVRPLRFRELLSRQPSPGEEQEGGEEDSPNSQLQREAASFHKTDTTRDDSISKSIGEGSGFNSSEESDSDACRSDSATRHRSKTPGRRRLIPLKTAASVGPKKASTRTVSTSSTVALKDNPPKSRPGDQSSLGKTPGKASKMSLTAKGGNLEDVFQKLKIFNDLSDSDSDKSGEKKTTAMDPATPTKRNKTIPPSPHKTPRIPLTPWKPEHNEFWDPKVNFEWIDKHSPEKPSQQATGPNNAHNNASSPKKKQQQQQQQLTTTDGPFSPTKKQQREAKKAFDEAKDGVARAFLAALDERVTEGKLTALTAATGGLRTVWSNALQTTAGRAHWKCRTVTRTTTHADGSTSTVREAQHEAHIELAAKVLTNEADLLNTVAHEFCHLAVFMLHHNPQDKAARRPAAHGAEFKAWGRRCGAAFAHRGIEVTTRHSYDIDYKFVWRCGDCATEVRRHSRSVDPRRHRCGRCRGPLVQVKPVPRGGSSAAAAATVLSAAEGGDNDSSRAKRQPSAWQEFLAREMKELSASRKGLSFEKKMEIVSGKWKVVRDADKGKEKEKEKEDDASTSPSTSTGAGSEDITEGVKALGIEDTTATSTTTTTTSEDIAVTATADDEEEEDDDDVVVISFTSG